MKTCQRCGASNPASHAFCGQCAAPLGVGAAWGSSSGSGRRTVFGAIVGAVIVCSTVVLAALLAVHTATEPSAPSRVSQAAPGPTAREGAGWRTRGRRRLSGRPSYLPRRRSRSRRPRAPHDLQRRRPRRRRRRAPRPSRSRRPSM